MTEYQIGLLQHAIGVNERQREPYRNYFLTEDGGTDNAAWLELVEQGYATSRPAPAFVGGGVIYHVTEKGQAEAISALPAPKKPTAYDQYLNDDSCMSFSEWLLGYKLPEVEYNRYGQCRMFRCFYDAACGYPRREIEGDWCRTKKAAKASYKEALKRSKELCHA